MKIRLIISLLFFIAWNGAASDRKAVEMYVSHLKKITDVMVYDVTSPVASARYYAYTTLASYEVMSLISHTPISHTPSPSILNSLKVDLEKPSFEIDKSKIDPILTPSLTLLKTALLLLPSGNKLQKEIDLVLSKIAIEKRKESEALADYMSIKIQKWALTDGFLKLNNLRKYTPKRGNEYWQPTAPAFMAPVEPNWSTIRPFFLDSAKQFRPIPPKKYSEEKDSPFRQELQEVYDISKKMSKEQIHIANFWDCNPYMISQIGHVEFGVKKISPGGHWMGITGIVCKNQKVSFHKSVLVHTILAMTLHDAFIVCWEEKYNSNRVRPETVINRLIDKTWRPLLQTPPFPEYVSGHSVASTASAKILTQLLGDNIRFIDDTEVEFGIKKRKFKSFKQAAEEASISRLYGGIHYRDGIVSGVWQGSKIGDFVLDKLKSVYSHL